MIRKNLLILAAPAQAVRPEEAPEAEAVRKGRGKGRR